MTSAIRTTAEQLTVVTLALGDQILAIPAKNLREILDPMPITRVPGASAFAPGVVNVRGSVVPLANLKVAFDIPETQLDERARIVVLDVVMDDEPLAVAMWADAVFEVTTINSAKIEAVPVAGSAWPVEFMSGIYRSDDGFVMLLNLDSILAAHVAGSATSSKKG